MKQMKEEGVSIKWTSSIKQSKNNNKHGKSSRKLMLKVEIPKLICAIGILIAKGCNLSSLTNGWN